MKAIVISKIAEYISISKKNINKVIFFSILIVSLHLASFKDAKSIVEKQFRHSSEKLTKDEIHIIHSRLHQSRFLYIPSKSYLNDKDSDTVINLFYELNSQDIESRVVFNIQEHRKYINYLIKQSSEKIYNNQSNVYNNIGKEIIS